MANLSDGLTTRGVVAVPKHQRHHGLIPAQGAHSLSWMRQEGHQMALG